MTSRITLNAAERAYVGSQPLGRLATVDANGAPQNNPVGVFLDEKTGDIVIGGGAMGASRKFRNVQLHPLVALVVDDIVSMDPWTVRGLEIRGTAVALSDVDPPVRFMSREVIPDHSQLDRQLGAGPRREGQTESTRGLNGHCPALRLALSVCTRHRGRRCPSRPKSSTSVDESAEDLDRHQQR
jgi:pyridoxamine 5'-phosphate oxidase family protein